MADRLGLALCGISLTAAVHGLYQLLRQLYPGFLICIDLSILIIELLLYKLDTIDLLSCDLSSSPWCLKKFHIYHVTLLKFNVTCRHHV